MQTELKISNVIKNQIELLQRINTIDVGVGSKIISKAIANNNWKVVFDELLSKLEFYTKVGVLDYTRIDMLVLKNNIAKFGVQKVSVTLLSRFAKTIKRQQKYQQNYSM